MLHVQIIHIGKTKEKFFIEAENEFLKRLSRYAKIRTDIIETGSNEDEKIQKRAWKDSYKIVLEITGKAYSSEDFAGLLKKMGEKGKVTFIIGGPHGLPQAVINKADLKLSLSKMTFTHQMVRIFLLEQIYRGFTILEGKTYHY
ncbi:23S rRNA (pseudouridine(1915)-N(3))-methyltransferase RlmH [Candidatus Peregrinibacteria bacterium]|nr:23S rRNA (pseudouridine(1915)-N(3))-methyltransferase RlmH [Candidatus Peregrinibacteria bacterium]